MFICYITSYQRQPEKVDSVYVTMVDRGGVCESWRNMCYLASISMAQIALFQIELYLPVILWPFGLSRK